MLEFNKKLSPVSRMDYIRIVLTIVASEKWEVQHIDVKSAFLHGYLEEDIYKRKPKGYIEKSSLVFKMRKYLYGIKKAPRAWYTKMDAFLLSQKFKRCK